MVIVDSSTLIHLSAIGRLSLLKDLYGHLTVTGAVWREVVDQGKGRPGVAELETARQAGWVEVVAPSNQRLLHSLHHHLSKRLPPPTAPTLYHPRTLVLF